VAGGAGRGADHRSVRRGARAAAQAARLQLLRSLAQAASTRLLDKRWTAS